MGIELGTATSLIWGYDATWDPADPDRDGLFRPEQAPLGELAVDGPADRGSWSFPQVSLHDSPEDLLGALFPHAVVEQPHDDAPPSIAAGALLIGDCDREAALRSLSATLGVDLATPDRGYALVRLRREDGIVEHPIYERGVFVNPDPRRPAEALGVQRDFSKAVAGLRTGIDPAGGLDLRRISTDQANAYLAIFRTWGTHFVSRVVLGETVFQVFACPAERFAAIRRAYASDPGALAGEDALDFDQFTVPYDEAQGPYGYVAERGHILALSGDPGLRESVDAGHWDDPVMAQGASIFAPFHSTSAVAFVDLGGLLEKSAPIRVELSSLGELTGRNRRHVWRRTFKGAINQKYAGRVFPNFVNSDTPPYADMLAGDDTRLLSTIATPSINVYKELLDVSDVQITAPAEVQELTLSANVVVCTGTDPVAIPGEDVVISAHAIDVTADGAARPVVLTDAAYDTYTLACRRFHGAFLVRNASGTKHHTIVDGLRYATSDDGRHGRSGVAVDADLRRPPDPELLPRLRNGLELSFVFAESVVNDRDAAGNRRALDFVAEYLRWIAEVVPAGVEDAELLDLRVRALDLANAASKPEPDAFVPLLPYADYKEDVDAILGNLEAVRQQVTEYQQRIAARRQEELVVDVAKDLNENIKKTGELISEMIGASAAQQADMSGFYQALVERQRADLDARGKITNGLEMDLHSQRAEVATAVANYKQALSDWERREQVKFALELVVDIFKVGKALADKPGENIGEALGALWQTAQTIGKFVNLVNSLGGLFDAADKSVELARDAQAAIAELGPLSYQTLGNLAWDEMAVHLGRALESDAGDSDVVDKRDALVDAFKILVLRGKAWLMAKTEQQAMARDLYLNQRRQELNERQAQRLDHLRGHLQVSDIDDLDRSAIDLVGLTGELAAIRRQTLAMLGRAFTLQDQALQYEYLQPPTRVKSFSLLHFRGALATQQVNKTRAKAKLEQHQSAVTVPIKFRLEAVDTAAMTNGRAYAFAIRLDSPQFLEYVHARVRAVVAKVDGVKETASGQYLVSLDYVGAPFADRDPDRNPLTFRTIRRDRTYEYECGTDAPQFTDEGQSWSKAISPITPFSTWEISFPHTEKNRDLAFAGSHVDIELSFVLEARIADQPLVPEPQARLGAAVTAAPRALAAAVTAAPRALAAAVTATAGSEQELVGLLHAQGSAVNGWDAVFSMSRGKINDSLKQQYEALKESTEYGNKITVTTEARNDGWGFCNFEKYNIEYGYPRLNFLDNEKTVELEMEVFATSSIQKCRWPAASSKAPCDQPPADPQCQDPAGLDAAEILTAKVDLDKITGAVEGSGEALSVMLDFATGSFDFDTMDLSDEEKRAFNKALKTYFTNNPVRFVINRLDLTDHATLAALKPSGFRFKVVKAYDMLQLYIVTGGRPLLDDSQAHLNNISWTIPQGFDCSLILSSRVMFGAVFPQAVSKGGWALTGVDPKDPHKAWTSEFTDGEITGDVDLSKLLDVGGYPGPPADCSSNKFAMSFGSISTYSFPGNKAALPITGMSLAAKPDGRLSLGFEREVKQTVNTETTVITVSCYSYSQGDPIKDSATFSNTYSIAGTIDLAVAGSGRDQQIASRLSARDITISGRTSGGGPSTPSGGAADDVTAKFNRMLKEQLPVQLKSKLDELAFTPVSVFALKNLLFPSGNYIALKQAYVPGDALLLGVFGSS